MNGKVASTNAVSNFDVDISRFPGSRGQVSQDDISFQSMVAKSV